MTVLSRKALEFYATRDGGGIAEEALREADKTDAARDALRSGRLVSLSELPEATAEEMAACESAYRRGYTHGWNFAIDKIRKSGDAAACRHLEKLMRWRWRWRDGFALPPT